MKNISDLTILEIKTELKTLRESASGDRSRLEARLREARKNATPVPDTAPEHVEDKSGASPIVEEAKVDVDESAPIVEEAKVDEKVDVDESAPIIKPDDAKEESAVDQVERNGDQEDTSPKVSEVSQEQTDKPIDPADKSDSEIAPEEAEVKKAVWVVRG